MQQDGVELVDSELLAVAVQVGLQRLGCLRVRLRQYRDLVAGDGLQRLAQVRVAAVLVGGVPERDALIEGRAHQLGYALVSQLPGLGGAAAAAVGASAHRETADGDLPRSEQDAVGREL